MPLTRELALTSAEVGYLCSDIWLADDCHCLFRHRGVLENIKTLMFWVA